MTDKIAMVAVSTLHTFVHISLETPDAIWDPNYEMGFVRVNEIGRGGIANHINREYIEKKAEKQQHG